MATSIAAVSGGSVSAYALQSARREAQQAERTANALHAQAQAAQRSADQEQARADGLSTQATDADDRSATARRSASNMDNASTTPPQRNVPFLNASGQATGLLLNATA
jgi:ATPase subunit of ABC transporter with duplicated ATPase domains